jgi:hypothetical protein
MNDSNGADKLQEPGSEAAELILAMKRRND